MSPPLLNPQHSMSDLFSENAIKLLALIIWKLRPNLAVEITAADMESLGSVFMSGGQRPMVACIGKRDSVVLQLVDEASGKMLLVTEGDENAPNAVMMRRSMEARKRAPDVADKLLKLRNVNDKELMREAAEILQLLTWEPPA